MTKHIVFAAILASSLMSIAAVPAMAGPSAADCAYAKQTAVTDRGAMFNYSAMIQQQCR